jgi:hypothetical protein
MAAAGAMIITNPDGEIYFNKSKEVFEKKHGKVKNGGKAAEYIVKSKPQTFYSVHTDVVIEQPWCSDGGVVLQFVPKDSKLNVTNKREPYSVTNVAFESTHTILA